MIDPEILKDIKELDHVSRRSNLAARNRLLSIFQDHQYVESLQTQLQIPFIPNERCGLWYLPHYETTCYFKSTDGHTSVWDFSTRRLNLNLLPLLEENHAIAIVDSTRRGKRMPDSLSKTIPIWCAILSRAVCSDSSWDDLLHLPYMVPASERDQILQKLPGLYNKWLQLGTTKPARPVRPIWVYPGITPPNLPEDCLTVVLVTASRMCQDGFDKQGFTYVQGAADDHELWARGLTPHLFWDNVDLLTQPVSEDEIDSRIDQLVASQTKKVATTELWQNVVQITPQLSLGKLTGAIDLDEKWQSQYDLVLVFDDSCRSRSPHCICYPLNSGSKKSSKELRDKLPEIVARVRRCHQVLIVCSTGQDISVGVLLACICEPPVDKTTIRRNLARITEIQRTNPSRATLNAVNYYLMS